MAIEPGSGAGIDLHIFINHARQRQPGQKLRRRPIRIVVTQRLKFRRRRHVFVQGKRQPRGLAEREMAAVTILIHRSIDFGGRLQIDRIAQIIGYGNHQPHPPISRADG